VFELLMNADSKPCELGVLRGPCSGPFCTGGRKEALREFLRGWLKGGAQNAGAVPKQ
jgi:hypothetical protein